MHLVRALNRITAARAALADAATPLPDVVALENDRWRAVARLLGSLSARERQVLEWRFGLGSRRDQTLEEVGQRLGLTKEGVRQIEKRALTRLRRLVPATARPPDAALGHAGGHHHDFA